MRFRKFAFYPFALLFCARAFAYYVPNPSHYKECRPEDACHNYVLLGYVVSAIALMALFRSWRVRAVVGGILLVTYVSYGEGPAVYVGILLGMIGLISRMLSHAIHHHED